MKSCKTLFLEKVFLGRETDFNHSDSVISQCVRLAYRDMLAAGRYYLDNDMNTRCSQFIEMLQRHQFQFSRDLIEDSLMLFGPNEIIGSGNKYVTRYGLSQKLVNMTYKNFFVCSDYIDRTIDFSRCDCPLDSIILSRLPTIDLVWSKMTKSKYEFCQSHISLKLSQMDLDNELRDLGNLAFDFLMW